MPNLKNAKKALRQSVVRASRNKLVAEKIDYLRRNIRKLITDNKLEDAKKMIADLSQTLDKAVGKNLIKSNTAARVKSRIMAHVNKVKA